MGPDWSMLLPFVGGFALGAPFGALIVGTRFCLVGSLSDLVLFSRPDRLIFWMVTALIGLVLTSTLVIAGVIDLSQSSCLTSRPVLMANLIGGVCFGLGMVLASGCVIKNLVRIGSGDLKSLTVIVFVIIGGAMTRTGQWQGLRQGLRGLWPLSIVQPVVSPAVLGVFALLTISGTILFCRRSRMMIGWSGAFALGALVASGWWVSTAIIAIKSIDITWAETASPESFSYVGSLIDLSNWLTGTSVDLSLMRYGFPIGIVIGTVVGAAAYYGKKGRWRWTGFRDSVDLLTHIVGGLLMGFGAVTAGGCSIAQGLSGVSTGSIGALISLLAMVGSGLAVLRYQARRLS